MNAFKEKCIELRKQDYTLNEIVKLTGRPKTSVYEHISQLPLSNKKIASIKMATGLRARQIAEKRRGVSERKFKKFNNWDKETVNFTAHFVFDGEIKHGGCVYNNRNLPLLDKVEKAMKTIYELEPRRYLNLKTGVSRISYHNVMLSAYMKEKAFELFKCVVSLSTELKAEFLRAFFDDEGCIDFRPKKNLRRVRGYQKDTSVLFLIKKLLTDFHIESKVIKPNEVVISGKENLIKFQKEINFSFGVRLNENRSNSIWKKPIEKRALLEQAIASFKT